MRKMVSTSLMLCFFLSFLSVNMKAQTLESASKVGSRKSPLIK